jgi:protein-tyrosine phosphatase
MILFVCEGNVCRSPLAAALLKASGPVPGSGLRIDCAGIAALVGQPADAETVEIGRRLGVDLSDHVARRLTGDDFRAAGLVLAATRDIRSRIVQLHAPAIRYTFTIRQAARVLANATDSFDPDGYGTEGTIAGLARFINQHRGPIGRAQISDDDVVDPYLQSRKVHEQAAQQLVPAISTLADALDGRAIEWVPAS